MEFHGYPKMARLSREMVVTEKIDGTNGQVYIQPACELRLGTDVLYQTNEFVVMAGSRTRWLTPEKDNFGFAAWVRENVDELLKLGPGRHFGEWWGKGIQRNYGLKEKRFSLFNVSLFSSAGLVSRAV
jgi:hypothetical protein